jgi:2-octaprenyl-6-methoxyphenol hydroxylase
VSQQQPSMLASLATTFGRRAEPELLITAGECGVDELGAVASYGAIVAPLQAAWLEAVAREPQRLSARFGIEVAALKSLDAGGVEVDAGIADRFDLAVVAEGGVFANQARKAVSRDYGQTAWVGQVTLAADASGTAYERFTPHGPAALLPLPPRNGDANRAALVWCVDAADDPVRDLGDAQRLAVLNSVFHARVGAITAVSSLKSFMLGLNAERTLVEAGRIVRIGNAAQTLHPVAGQGLNLGLRDAHALVAALADAARRPSPLPTAPLPEPIASALQREPFASAMQSGPVAAAVSTVLNPDPIAAALRRVEWQRAPDRWTLIAATDFLARSFTWRLPGLTTARGLGLTALQTLGPARRALARQMMFGSR